MTKTTLIDKILKETNLKGQDKFNDSLSIFDHLLDKSPSYLDKTLKVVKLMKK
jgi:hypothetical protein